MNEFRDAIVKSYGELITYILTSTDHDKDDPDARNRVASNISRAIRMVKTRSHKDILPQETNIYKLSVLLHDMSINSRPEFFRRAKGLLGRYGNIASLQLLVNNTINAGLELKPLNPMVKGIWEGELLIQPETPPKKWSRKLKSAPPITTTPEPILVAIADMEKVCNGLRGELESISNRIQKIEDNSSHVMGEFESELTQIKNKLRSMNMDSVYLNHCHLNNGEIVFRKGILKKMVKENG